MNWPRPMTVPRGGDRAYPFVTHLRGFVAHLVYGLGTAVAAETDLDLERNASRSGRRQLGVPSYT